MTARTMLLPSTAGLINACRTSALQPVVALPAIKEHLALVHHSATRCAANVDTTRPLAASHGHPMPNSVAVSKRLTSPKAATLVASDASMNNIISSSSLSTASRFDTGNSSTRDYVAIANTVKPPEMVVVVDQFNNVIGYAPRKEAVNKYMRARVTFTFLQNSAGELFVSKRSEAKDCYPGCLDVSVSGVVNQGEEYHQTAVRELHEEVNIPMLESKNHLQQLFTFPYQDKVCRIWGCAFIMSWDGPLAFLDEEVEWGQFMSVPKLQQLLERHPESFSPVGRHVLGLYLGLYLGLQQPALTL
eukprot:GHRR01018662.1.p1 GENE.GHRR01018662.1~~GHRR01018662.1.p1  ORF type:complete len:302 (+),score=67.63 GHRR01018662.1:417-1322(+)